MTAYKESIGTPGSSVGRASDSRSRAPEIEPALGTWWWGRIPPKQPYSRGAALAATTLLADLQFPGKGVNIV